jgi:aspartate racemase
MKTIGLLGGMSWESTLTYYREINSMVNARLGGLHSAKIILCSVDFDPIEKQMQQGDWEGIVRVLTDAACGVAAAGADCLLICTNTMHKVADPVASALSIPLLHIADATAERLSEEGIRKVGLLGTAFTMEQAFYKGRLADKFGLDVLVPDVSDRQRVNDVIFQELCLGITKPSSKQTFLRIVDRLVQDGAQGVILGCTEIGLLIDQDDTPAALFDTTAIHAAKAVDWALEA